MREILFRGMTPQKVWVEGYYTFDGFDHLICVPADKTLTGEPVYHEVLPFTIGQWTGLTDRDGVKIFEGDVVSLTDEIGALRSFEYEVRFENTCFALFHMGNTSVRMKGTRWGNLSRVEELNWGIKVITNIYEGGTP